ncbi:hypothetical protein [Streptomyces sp. NRRL F-5755]|uniref:hypothetical protein n=1 Tax=Streptomyces sp. NRRL F-5755 TaxID=1519475 RepID=UPI000A49C15C|nr:hypothetical protein [Streptomyces sp. NRRL F-5755]
MTTPELCPRRGKAAIDPVRLSALTNLETAVQQIAKGVIIVVAVLVQKGHMS